MDKYNSKTSFQKWVSSINLNDLSEKSKKNIENFDHYHYSKKVDFRTLIKELLHAVYEELPSYREIDCAFLDKCLRDELGSLPFVTARCHVRQQSLVKKS